MVSRKIYLAARYDRREEMYGYAKRLEALGFTVASTWVDGRHEIRPNVEATATTDEWRYWALEDLADLRATDTFLFFSEPPESNSKRGGRHVEYGYALALGLNLLVVGPRENVFHYLSKVRHVADFEEAISALGESW